MGTTSATILVVDDEPDLRTLYELTLLREGYRVETAGTLAAARDCLSTQTFDVLITDMRLPDGLGMELLRNAREQGRTERIIVMTAYGSADNAVEALRYGAFDYLTKPVDLKQFRTVVASAINGQAGVLGNASTTHNSHPAAITGAALKPGFQPGEAALARLVGNSAPMQLVKQRIQKVAQSMAPVLISGESGTGKELVARALHACSHRAHAPWIAVNCGAIPEHLLEAEFFGARKGAYTGATADREGFFSAARGGTLFLDEIGELPLSMQAKLLRAIQERCVRPLGSTQEESVDVRIVSATHRNLVEDVAAGRFRQDLYYRLNVIDIPIPPLRERREDLPALCQVLLERIASHGASSAPTVSNALLQKLKDQPLPGNVRELENLLHRALALGEEMEDAPSTPSTPDSAHRAGTPMVTSQADACEALDDLPSDLQAWLDLQERQILTRALQACGYNRTAAAARLGISLRQMRYRIDRLNIPVSAEDMDHASDNPLYDLQP